MRVNVDNIVRSFLVGFALCLALSGCATIEDCGNVLGNKTDARIRSSQARMFLQDPSAAMARFAPYAAMSALVYEEAKDCKRQLPPVGHKDVLIDTLAKHGWHRDDAVPNLPKCDDDIGTFFRVWTKDYPGHREVVLVFRGTKGGLRDWIHGNLRWFTRYLPGEDQYERSRKFAGDILKYYRNGAGRQPKPLWLYAAGHSLGGGLAQNLLYHYPDDFLQAYAFDPSPVTGFADNEPQKQRAGCDCRSNALDGEARVYRIYETDEVLAWLRFPLKLVVPLNRHIQEVRFTFDAGHSMADLALGMISGAGARPLGTRSPWWEGKLDPSGRSCTNLYRDGLKASCQKSSQEDFCPS